MTGNTKKILRNWAGVIVKFIERSCCVADVQLSMACVRTWRGRQALRLWCSGRIMRLETHLNRV